MRHFLLDCGRPHALALFYQEIGDYATALDIWRRLALGELVEKSSTSGATMQAGGDGSKVGKFHAARLLVSHN